MVMATTCPACHTRFRVTPEQIEAHGGDVRCGRCAKVFNAHVYLEHELEELQHEGQSKLPFEELGDRAALPEEEAKQQPAEVEEFPAEKLETPLFEEVPVEEGLVQPLPAGDELGAESSVEAESSTPEWGAEELPEPPAAEEFLLPESVVPAPAEPVIIEYVTLEPDIVEPGIAEPDISETVIGKNSIGEPSIGEPSMLEPEFVPEPVAEPSVARNALVEIADEPKKRVFFWLWPIGAVVLLASLSVQGLYFFRSDLAASHPEFKPFLQEFCGVLQCSIRLPANPNFLSIETSNLEADPQQANLIALNAILRNRARLAQEYPQLELTLTDTQDRMIARRIFTPKEYAKSADLKRGMAPNEEVTVKLYLDLGDLKASGYRVFLFYPQ